VAKMLVGRGDILTYCCAGGGGAGQKCWWGGNKTILEGTI
jgi:hypothetical protein